MRIFCTAVQHFSSRESATKITPRENDDARIAGEVRNPNLPLRLIVIESLCPMGTITSIVGLIRGIDYKSLVDKLISVQSGTVNHQTAQNKAFDGQRTAITSLEASLIALQ